MQSKADNISKNKPLLMIFFRRAHKHPHEQTGIMISGRMLFSVDDKQLEVAAGDSWCVPGDSEHSVITLEDSVVVEVFSPVRQDYLPK